MRNITEREVNILHEKSFYDLYTNIPIDSLKIPDRDIGDYLALNFHTRRAVKAYLEGSDYNNIYKFFYYESARVNYDWYRALAHLYSYNDETRKMFWEHWIYTINCGYKYRHSL